MIDFTCFERRNNEGQTPVRKRPIPSTLVVCDAMKSAEVGYQNLSQRLTYSILRKRKGDATHESKELPLATKNIFCLNTQPKPNMNSRSVSDFSLARADESHEVIVGFCWYIDLRLDFYCFDYYEFFFSCLVLHFNFWCSDLFIQFD